MCVCICIYYVHCVYTVTVSGTYVFSNLSQGSCQSFGYYFRVVSLEIREKLFSSVIFIYNIIIPCVYIVRARA